MKTTVAIIFGGKSAEFNVSLNSASNIFNAFDKELFNVLLVGITRTGEWYMNPDYPIVKIDLTKKDFFEDAVPVIVQPEAGNFYFFEKGNPNNSVLFDVAFPIIHGTFGEDGTLQGLFKSFGIPFVGPDILASAICMDKDITKRLLRESGIPVAKSITVFKQKQDVTFAKVIEELGLPVFVKPCNAGSSVGVSKVENEIEFYEAKETAFRFDRKLLIEEAVIGKELECAVLGNETPKGSIIGEIVPMKDFYSYQAKYKETDGAKMSIPANIDNDIAQQIRQVAVAAFKATCCEGMARVDFFLRADNSFVLNEINTLPGFTEISMYPKLWEQTGISYSNLITELVKLALLRSKRDKFFIS